MKKIMIASAALALMCGSAFAQNSTGPAPQSDNMQKPGTSNMDKGSMNKGTTGMNSGMTNETSKGGMKPDASGQSGSGAGGTKGSPGSMK